MHGMVTVETLFLLGVEFAAELRDLVREDLKHLYPHLIDHCRVTLVEALPQILNAYDENVTFDLSFVYVDCYIVPNDLYDHI
jgi:hypothetical protein